MTGQEEDSVGRMYHVLNEKLPTCIIDTGKNELSDPHCIQRLQTPYSR